MKTIHINRHAKSSWKNHLLSDHDRPLNKRGKINAKFMSDIFAKNNTVDLIVSSTAKRAHATAKAFAKELNIPIEQIELHSSAYASGVQDLMSIIHGLDDQHNSIMLFGHNPGLSFLAEHLDQNHRGHLVTCARIKIVFEVDSWQAIGADSGQVVEHDYPRKYPEMANL